MQIKIDVSQLEDIDLSTVVGEHLNYDPTEGESAAHLVTLGDIVAEKIAEHIVAEDRLLRQQRKEIARIREDLIRSLLAPIVSAAIEGPIHRTNSFGEPIGKPVTLRELIVDETKKLISERRNKSGYPDHKGSTLLETLIKKEVESAFVQEVRDLIDLEKKKITDALRVHAAEVLAKTIEDAAVVIKRATTE